MQNPDHRANFHQGQRPNFWVFLPKAGDADFRLFATWRIPPRPKGGKVGTLPIIYGDGAYFTLKELQTSSVVLLLTPVLFTCHGVRLTHAPLHTAYGMTSFVAGVGRVWEALPISAILSSILGFIVGTTTGRLRLLNKSCPKFLLLVSVTFSFPLLVWVAVFGSRVILPCLSLVVAEFDT